MVKLIIIYPFLTVAFATLTWTGKLMLRTGMTTILTLIIAPARISPVATEWAAIVIIPTVSHAPCPIEWSYGARARGYGMLSFSLTALSVWSRKVTRSWRER